MFGNIKFEKRKFHHIKKLILSEYVDIDGMLIYSIVFASDKNYKYFICYKIVVNNGCKKRLCKKL